MKRLFLLMLFALTSLTVFSQIRGFSPSQAVPQDDDPHWGSFIRLNNPKEWTENAQDVYIALYKSSLVGLDDCMRDFWRLVADNDKTADDIVITRAVYPPDLDLSNTYELYQAFVLDKAAFTRHFWVDKRWSVQQILKSEAFAIVITHYSHDIE